MVPFKQKTGISVASALQGIFKERRSKPEKLWVDKGKEFYSKDVKKLTTLYSTENEEKSCVAERWNRTMKEKMFKYFSANSTRTYVDVLDELVRQYNNTIHSSIKITPAQASRKENETNVWRNLYGRSSVSEGEIKPKFSIGDSQNNKEKIDF